ncbi:alpha-amylase family glycosyl hydrolase [Oscillatoria salina]|uniref:alpha-amylase family glycosyl hydrolase n=1 Tax=Oscillatoria salina TaxID=331517 RepID=UPI0013B6929F|nr:alpha-amylase family glycosyl hydrolase [Oscillatoria salina]MBZ8181948.1 alpha amylase [Oscillatoria salina IIICB1]NET89154.1 alpha amylase [Kamptonema sp. SIO1D9]
MLVNFLQRKQIEFILWRPKITETQPTLLIGTIATSSHNPYENFREIPLQQSKEFPELWFIAANQCNLQDGQVYFYWFKIINTNPYENQAQIMYCTDPTATTVDRRFLAPIPPENQGVASFDPASVILYQKGKLIPCDPQGETVTWENNDYLNNLPPNNRLVIYELPPRWTIIAPSGETEVGIGTFQDVLSLFDTNCTAPDFSEVEALRKGCAHLRELGINALELLPVSDSDDKFEWGYGTANYLAADFDLGHPKTQIAPTASVDLAKLIQTCHQQGVRFFIDVVMAFSRNNPYRNLNFSDFYVRYNSNDPEGFNRESFGGDLFKYNYWVEGYQPLSGEKGSLVPSREYMKVFIAHWLEYYRVDGIRIDSVNNISNYDFVEEFKNLSREIWKQRGGSSDRFLVVGEELSVPLALIQQNRLDSLWNEHFKTIARKVILGQNSYLDNSFEWNVKKLIDCRFLGFTDGSQVVNYLTSHDVGGFGNERLYNYLVNNGVYDSEKRIKLAFVCLLTAVGIPMILAGDEFGDRHDLDISDEHSNKKQVDPVNFNRLRDDWRQRIFQYVTRLVRFRTTFDALAVNDTNFIHGDFNEGKRVVVWQRGVGENMVVVVANFSDYGTPNPVNPTSEYVIPNFPSTPVGKQWQEITQNRLVPSEWIGREPIFPWEAKVYALV